VGLAPTLQGCCGGIARVLTKASLHVRGVGQTLVKQVVDVLVDQGVKHVSAVLAGGDDAQIAQHAQLMRHRRLAHTQDQAQVADTQLDMGQQANDPHAGWVGQGREDFGNVAGGDAVQQVILDSAGQRLVVVAVTATG